METLLTEGTTEFKMFQVDDQNERQPSAETGSSENKKCKYNYDLKVGELDYSGARVTRVYSQQKDKYVIYSTDEKLYPVVTAEDETPLREDTDICNEILQYRDYKENDPHLKDRFNAGYSLAISTILEEHPDVGRAALRTVIEEIESFLQREATFYYMLGAVLATAIVLVNYLIFYQFESAFDVRTQIVFHAVAFSALGGFLSVALGSGKVNVELRNDELSKAIYGALRIAIAIISGVIVYYALKSYVFSTLQLSETALYVICAGAGFLEKLVPNLMHNVESKSGLKAGG